MSEETFLDLSKYHFKRILGDLTFIGTWIRLDDRYRQCLVMIRTNDELSEHCQPCVITVDQAYIWSQIKGIGDPREAARQSACFAEALRLDTHNLKTFMRLASLIDDHLGDLLHIPPYVADEPAPVIADVIITDQATGKTIREAELRD